MAWKAELEQYKVLSHIMSDLSVEFIAIIFSGNKNYNFELKKT